MKNSLRKIAKALHYNEDEISLGAYIVFNVMFVQSIPSGIVNGIIAVGMAVMIFMYYTATIGLFNEWAIKQVNTIGEKFRCPLEEGNTKQLLAIIPVGLIALLLPHIILIIIKFIS